MDFEKELGALLERLDTAKRHGFGRSLPVGDLLVDRWERAARLGFGKKSSIYNSSIVLGDVKVGENTWIGPNTILDGSGKLMIGSNCSISAGVQIYSHDSVAWAKSGAFDEIERSPVKIGDNCYIGPNAVIARGVTIGDGATVGALSLVTTDVPAGAKALGVPAKIRKSDATES